MPSKTSVILRSAVRRVSKDAGCRRRDRLWRLAALVADCAAMSVALRVLPAAARGCGGNQPDPERRHDPALYTAVHPWPGRARKPCEPCQLLADRRGRSACLCEFADPRRAGNRAVSPGRLSDRLRHRPRAESLAQPAAVLCDLAVLDEPSDPRLCLDRDPSADRPPQPRTRWIGPHRSPDPADLQRFLGRSRPRLRVSAVHDPAALRQPVAARREPGRGRRRSRGAAGARVPRCRAAAVVAGRRRWGAARLHPGDRRVCDPRFARRPGDADGGQGDLAGILRQCRLARGCGGRDGARRAADRAVVARAASRRAPRDKPAMSRRITTFRAAALVLGFGFLYLPIALLIAYSFNASRLVAVWGGWSLHWYAALWDDDKFRGAARNSLEIGIMAASLALVFGTCAGIAIQRFARFRLRLVFSLMLMAPLVVPEVILGLSLLLLFVAWQAWLGLAGG